MKKRRLLGLMFWFKIKGIHLIMVLLLVKSQLYKKHHMVRGRKYVRQLANSAFIADPIWKHFNNSLIH